MAASNEQHIEGMLQDVDGNEEDRKQVLAWNPQEQTTGPAGPAVGGLVDQPTCKLVCGDLSHHDRREGGES